MTPVIFDPDARAKFLSSLQYYENFEKCSILFKFKEGEDFNNRNILNISRIEI